ncbi:MAG: hypothetical protein KC503_27150 [Myxococcales bacterium]|nr:hypothetical protein [Myxococcales bacterium]
MHRSSCASLCFLLATSVAACSTRDPSSSPPADDAATSSDTQTWGSLSVDEVRYSRFIGPWALTSAVDDNTPTRILLTTKETLIARTRCGIAEVFRGPPRTDVLSKVASWLATTPKRESWSWACCATDCSEERFRITTGATVLYFGADSGFAECADSKASMISKLSTTNTLLAGSVEIASLLSSVAEDASSQHAAVPGVVVLLGGALFDSNIDAEPWPFEADISLASLAASSQSGYEVTEPTLRSRVWKHFTGKIATKQVTTNCLDPGLYFKNEVGQRILIIARAESSWRLWPLE